MRIFSRFWSPLRKGKKSVELCYSSASTEEECFKYFLARYNETDLGYLKEHYKWCIRQMNRDVAHQLGNEER